MSAELLKMLQKKYKTGVYSHDSIPKLERVSSGVATLDRVLGGGLPLGRIIELFGPESVGKSSVCLAMAQAAVERGDSVLYQDLEKTVTSESLSMYGLDNDQFVITRPVYGEMAIDQAVEAAELGCKLIIIDTVAMLLPKSVQDKFDNDSEARDVAGPAGMINRLKNKITDHIEHNQAVLVFINQIRDNLNSPHGGVSTPGGHALKHMASIRVRLTHAVRSQNVAGRIMAQVKIEKNKTYTPGLQCEIPIVNGLVQRTESLVLTCVELGLIKKAGSWYNSAIDLAPFGCSNQMGQGSGKVAVFLDDNPTVKQFFTDQVLQYNDDSDLDPDEQ
jgi:recombination protein RecA